MIRRLDAVDHGAAFPGQQREDRCEFSRERERELDAGTGSDDVSGDEPMRLRAHATDTVHLNRQRMPEMLHHPRASARHPLHRIRAMTLGQIVTDGVVLPSALPFDATDDVTLRNDAVQERALA